MTERGTKTFRDPIHGNIKILPFELNIISLKIFQRLRYLKQTPSVAFVFHSANHTRFEHSIGCLHIAEMYTRNLGISNPERELLRLCALLHDIGHGPFSHQYDETVYKEIYPAEKYGHDKHRMRIIREYLPKILLETYGKKEIKKSFELSGLRDLAEPKAEESISLIMNKVTEILENEGSVFYNIIHGPFGCDRMDFIKRDSYFSGTSHYGGFPMDRFILFSSIRRDENNNEILCYSSKILDDILLLLINRFHMFKNVYFHKTCRALDLMLQQILRYSTESLDLVRRTENFEEFEKLNDTSLIYEILYRFSENSHEIGEAYELVNRILRRDLYKTVIDEAEVFTAEQIRKYTASGLLRTLAKERKEKLEQLYEKKEGSISPKLFVDTPYEIKMSPLQELPKSNIDIYDETENVVRKYRDIESERSFKTWDVKSFNIYRIYTTSNTERKKLIPYARAIMKRKRPKVDTQI
jgi:HD superfamily phosphohydrolase